MKYIRVRFSGKAVPCNYSFDPDIEGRPVIGTRVVVPTKMKSDGSVTLAIASVIAVSGSRLPNSEKPIIGFLCGESIYTATAVCARLEVERVQVIT